MFGIERMSVLRWRPGGSIPCALLFVVAPTAHAQARATEQSRVQELRAYQHVPVVLTISGGASLGSYEAGVNWGLLEVFKLTARDSIRLAWNLPQYDLKVMTGASAGSINGFLAAIEWCRTRAPTAPDQSLFWKVWVRTGFDQIFPLERYDQQDTTQALFSRRYFDLVLSDSLKAAMGGLSVHDAPQSCSIPVGVTVTRVAPDSVAISQGLYALTQRYAAIVLVSRRGPSLEFRAPHTEFATQGALGALLPMPECDSLVDPRDVFSLIEASSAFPGLFRPVVLRREAAAGAGCRGGPIDSSLFSDGGLFDNNPIDLATGIYDEMVWKNTFEPDSSALLVFIDPDRVRGRIAHVVQNEARPPAASGGVAALFDLFAGAVPAARQYELQSFGRLLARAPAVFVRENIESTDRGFLVVGQRLGNFAAFLGKPFREYDFYVGIYDALSFFAREGCQAPTVDSLCVQRRLRELVETRALDLGAGAAQQTPDTESLARTVLRLLYQREWGRWGEDTTRRMASEPSVRPPTSLVVGLARAHFSLEDEIFDNSRCRSGDPIADLLCRDGFRMMLGQVESDIEGRPLGQTIGQDACAPTHWLTSPIECDEDQSFGEFVGNPEHFLADKFGLMLHQLWRVERARERAGEQNWTSVATVTEVLFQSGIGYRYRRGFDANASSVPRQSGAAWLTALIPNYVGIDALSRSVEVGYRPTRHLNNSWALSMNTTPLQVVGDPSSELDRYRWTVGPALHWKRVSTLWSGWETGVERIEPWRSSIVGARGQVWAIPVSWYLLADKLRLCLRLFPGGDSGVQGRPIADFGIGIADVNGLAYWLLRR